MSDAKLRDLERDAAQGDFQAQARLLRERVRLNALTSMAPRVRRAIWRETPTLPSAN